MTAPACSPRYGKMKAAERNKLPDSAFGLPKERKYPMFRIWGTWAIPDAEHAANAKARATRELEKKKITPGQYNRIVRKADRVLDACSKNAMADRARKASKNPAKKKKASKKSAKKNGKRPRKKNAAPATYAKTHGGLKGPTPRFTASVPNPATEPLEDLGELIEVTYRTTKAGDGGEADYVHKFRNPRPRLLVTRNGRGLVVTRGGFRVNARGIVG